MNEYIANFTLHLFVLCEWLLCLMLFLRTIMFIWLLIHSCSCSFCFAFVRRRRVATQYNRSCTYVYEWYAIYHQIKYHKCINKCYKNKKGKEGCTFAHTLECAFWIYPSENSSFVKSNNNKSVYTATAQACLHYDKWIECDNLFINCYLLFFVVVVVLLPRQWRWWWLVLHSFESRRVDDIALVFLVFSCF